ncbi:hypothetical protein [Lentzea sp. NPDC003310]|uniref:hypothetical protein n=1 Tax=Lentzea sp. NPDC003310 TaxID=3154447 RepID=UPI0033A537AA
MKTDDKPLTVRIAVGLWLAIAAFVVLTTVLLWRQHDVFQRLSGWTSAEVTSFLWLLTAVALVFTGAYTWLTRVLLRRRAWARAALSFVAIVHMIWILLVGISASGLVTLLLICVAIVLTWQPRTAQWLAEVREQ